MLVGLSIKANMTRPLLFTTGCALSLFLCSCDGQKRGRSVEEITSSLHIVQPDTSVIGTLKAITHDTLTFISELRDESFSCAFNVAQDQSNIYGSLTEENRYAVLIDPDEKEALKIFNLTELSGQWFYDDDPESGLTFTAAGALNSINTHDVSFRKWKIYNGHIIIFYTDIEEITKDSRQCKSDTTELVSLSSDALSFRFLGKTRSCHRQNKEALKVKFQF